MTALSFVSRTDKQIVISVAAGGGETTFEIEINRQPDFASDESMSITGVAAGNVNINGLCATTNYYIRGRATNTNPKGAWSNVLVQATLLPAAPATYVGFSIEPTILVVPEPFESLTCADAEAGSSALNLANSDPLSTLRVQNDSAFSIIFKTNGRPIDTFALLGTNANNDATWRIRGADSQAGLATAPVDTGSIAFRASPEIGQRPNFHAFRRLTALYEHPWWQIDVTHNAPTFWARHLVVGKARQSVNYSRGMSIEPFDLGTTNRSNIGGPDRIRGWRGRGFSLGLSWLSEAEFEAKWSDLDMLVGTTDPVLVVTNPKANTYLNDRIGYGEITDMSAENVRSSKWNRSLTLRSLY